MKVHTVAEMRQVQADQAFRTSAAHMLAFPVILAGVCLGLGWAVTSGVLPGIFWISVVVLAALIPLSVCTNGLPALRESNWVIKTSGNRVFVQLSDYRNTNLPDDTTAVVSFAASEIRAVGQHKKKVTVPIGRGRQRHWTEWRLELHLKADVPAEFEAAAESIPVWSVRGPSRSRNHPSPVSHAGRTVRILWSGPNACVRPSLPSAVDCLRRMLPNASESHLANAGIATTESDTNDWGIDDRLLDLCLNGDRMDAIKLLCDHHDLTETEAKQWVEEVAG